MKKEIIVGIIGTVLFIAVIVLSSILFTGCMTSPKRSNYKSDVAFMAADCGYRYQKNSTICSDIIKAYSRYVQEKSQFDKVIFCKNIKNYLPHWNKDSEKCLLYLNQK